jgi:hypothetical protein
MSMISMPSDKNTELSNSVDFMPAPKKGGTLLDDEQLKALQKDTKGKALVDYIRKEYQKSKDSKQWRVRQWYINMSFERGKQYVAWDSTKSQIAQLPRGDKNIPRITINRVRPIVRTEISKLTSQKPTAVALPASNDVEDIFAATAAGQIWDSLYDRLRVGKEMRAVARDLSVLGVGYLKTYWHAGAYDNWSDQEGDICIEHISPFNVFVPDLSIVDHNKQPYVLHVYTKPLEWVKMTYEGLIPKDKQPTVVASTEIADISSALDIRENNSKPDACLVIEAWVKPGTTAQLPKGGYITIVDDIIVEASLDGFPPGYKDFPIVKFDHVPSGQYYSACVIDDILPLQREINRTRSQRIQAKNMMAKPQVYYREGSLTVAKINTSPGQYIGVRPGFDFPVSAPMPQLPPYVAEELQALNLDLEDISGQHQVSKGSTPPGVEAATAIAYLQERDDSYLAPTFASIEEGLSAIARMTLALAAEYWTSERTVKIVGSNNGFSAELFRGSDIAKGTDIRIEAGSALPTSKAAKQALVMDMARMGMIPPEDALELLDVSTISRYTDNKGTRPDELMAQRENIKFKNMTEMEVMQHYQRWEQGAQNGNPEMVNPDDGTPLQAPSAVAVNKWDNHAVHIQEHDNFRKSPAYDMLTPTQKAEFNKHINIHEMALANLQAQQMMAGYQQQEQTAPDDQAEQPAQ